MRGSWISSPPRAASGAEQPFARWPVLGTWPRGLNDRSEKGVCISWIGSTAAKIRPSLAYEGGNSFLRVIGSAGRDDGVFFCGELVGQTGFECLPQRASNRA